MVSGVLTLPQRAGILQAIESQRGVAKGRRGGWSERDGQPDNNRRWLADWPRGQDKFQSLDPASQ